MGKRATSRRTERQGRGSGRRAAGIASVVLAIMSAAAACAAEDGEYRGQAVVTKGVGGAKLSVGFEARSAGEFGDIYYRAPSVAVAHPVGEVVVIAGGYAQVETKGPTGWCVEQRPHGDVALKWTVLGLSLSDRNRIELRVRDDKGVFRYRNRFRAARDLGSTGLRARVDDEVFVDVEGTEMSKNRLTVAMDARIAAATRVGVFYVFESSKKPDGWASVHGIGAVVSCTL